MKLIATRWLFLLALIALPVGSALGQVTTATLTGTVVDNTGAPLPGANVVAVHEPTGTQYGTATRLDGRYDLLNLRVGGPYTVTVSFIGFEEKSESNLTLQLGQPRILNFELAESATELGEVEVVGLANTVLNSDRTGASTNVSNQTIERLPTVSRSLADFARLTPQSSGGSSLAGRNNRYNNIQIDGATLNDVFGLSGTGAPGGQASAQPISLDAIEEFNVDIAPYDVRYNGFTGGSINAVTKSGTNQFHGSVRYLGRNQSFVGTLQDATGEDTEFGEFSEYYIVGNVGGPIMENKLFFFVNAEYEKESSPLDAGIAGSSAANIFPVDQATLDRIANIAQSYGYNPGGVSPLTQGRNNLKLLGKIDWNINQNHRLTLRNNYVDADDEAGINRNSSNFDFSNRQYIFRSKTNSAVADLRSTVGSNMFNQARLVYTRIRDARDVQAEAFPYVEITVDDDGNRAYLGIDRFSQANALDQDIYEFTNDFTYITGQHNITLGTSNQIYKFRNLFIQDLYGAYQFSSIDDFETGSPSRYFLSYSQLEGTPQPEAEFTSYQVGFYAQDQYTVSPTLSVTAGIRVDVPLFPDEPIDNPAAREAFGLSTTNTASGNLLFSPRLGFNWDASGGARTTQVRGGTGIFSGRSPYVWISNQYSNTGAELARVDKRDLPAGCFVPSANPLDQPRPGTALGTQCGLEPILTSEINLIDEDFKFPQVWRTNVAVDQQLPWGVIGTLEGLYTKSLNDVTYRNLNIERTGTAVGGRALYGEASTNGSPAIIDSRFTNALLLENTNEGYEYSITAQLRKQSSIGLDGSLSYTYNRAENVNNGTSSRAISNWQFNEAIDINDATLATSDFELRHRILANLSYRAEYADRFATTVAVVYEGRSGAPFSWIYNGNANGDPQRFNDPVYVPASEDEIDLTSDNWDALNAFIEDEPALRDARGEIVLRNAARAPWRNILDLNVTQHIQTLQGQRVELTANLLNVLNLINSGWGEVLFAPNDNRNLLNFSGYDESGRPIVSYSPPSDTNGDGEVNREDLFERSDLASRWQLQLGIRLVF